MWETLIPLAGQILGGGGGGGGGLLGALGGGKTEVKQSVSQSTTAALLASINNTIGAGSSSSGAQTPTITQNPNALATSGTSPSPAPVYGQTFGPDYTTGDLSSTPADTSSLSMAGLSPVMVLGAMGAVAWFLLKGKK